MMRERHEMLRTRLVFLALGVFVGVSFAANVAWSSPAVPPTTEALAEARREFFAGVEAQDAGRYREALTWYLRAGQVALSPTILFNIGSCREQVGELIEAEAAFERAAAEAQARSDGEVASEALAKVSALRERIPRLVVRLPEHVRTEDLLATLDDAPIALTTTTELRLNPGTHRLAIRSERYARAFALTVDLPAQATRTIDVDLGGERSDVLKPPPASRPSTTAPAAPTYAPALIAGGVAFAFAGGALGTWLVGRDASHRYDAMNGAPTAANRAEREDLRSSVQTALVLNAGCIVGAALAAGTAVYFLVRPPKGGTRASASLPYMLAF